MPVAQRMYARALFQAAREEGRLDVVHEQVGDFAAALRDVPELRGALANPELDVREKAAIVEEILAAADELVRNFVLLTVEKGRAAEIEAIYEELEALVAEVERRLTVELTTAIELTDEEAAAILGQIERASGREVEATRMVDPSLIGGIVLQAGSLRVDASTRGRLAGLRHELTGRGQARTSSP